MSGGVAEVVASYAATDRHARSPIGVCVGRSSDIFLLGLRSSSSREATQSDLDRSSSGPSRRLPPAARRFRADCVRVDAKMPRPQNPLPGRAASGERVAYLPVELTPFVVHHHGLRAAETFSQAFSHDDSPRQHQKQIEPSDSSLSKVRGLQKVRRQGIVGPTARQDHASG